MNPLDFLAQTPGATLDAADRIARMGSAGILALIVVVLAGAVYFLSKENTRLNGVIHATLEKNKVDIVDLHDKFQYALAEERDRHDTSTHELNGHIINRLETLTEASRALRDVAERMEDARDSFTAGTPVHGVPAPTKRRGNS